MIVAKKMWSFLEDKLEIDGMTLIQNNGDVQHVKHYHLHLKPYYNSKKPISDVDEIYNILKK
jgi:diadenosine tetraphosphate (Ap4A) HIT family hydrolase